MNEKKLIKTIKRLWQKLPRLEVKIISDPTPPKPHLSPKPISPISLISRTPPSSLKKIAKLWLFPILLAISLFAITRPITAQIAENADLATYLANNNIEVGAEPNGSEYPQIYYLYNNVKTFITNSNYTNGAPDAQGEWITWMSEIDGTWQIFLHNILSQTTVQLTRWGNNVNPKVSKGNVAWEGWVQSPTDSNYDNWQIFVYGEDTIRQITQESASIHPDIEGDYVAFSQKTEAETWNIRGYSINENKVADIDVNITGNHVEIKNNFVYYGKTSSDSHKFPLSLEELFMLDLPPLTNN